MSQFIREIRLREAYTLLQNEEGNVTQVGVMVGFRDNAQFSREFKLFFGVSPSQLKKG
ncbi:MAG: helix-turn-helix domain-containing protein [Bacteroidales bacterium]|nr:helix-turn-helix domain-containing protein [Bacteroidales bacterium]